VIAFTFLVTMEGRKQIFFILTGNFRYAVAWVGIFVFGNAVAAGAGVGKRFARFGVALQLGGVTIARKKQSSQ